MGWRRTPPALTGDPDRRSARPNAQPPADHASLSACVGPDRRSVSGRHRVPASPSLPDGGPHGCVDASPHPAAHRDLAAAILRAVERGRTAVRCTLEGPPAAGAIQGCHVSSRIFVFPDIHVPCGFFFDWADCHRTPRSLTSGENGIWLLARPPGTSTFPHKTPASSAT